MKSQIQINNQSDICHIDIEGTIGMREEWQFDEPDARVATYEKFRDTLRRIEEIEAARIVVEIRSTGGDVNDALLIHDALCSTGAQITTRCYGYTASAATIIAQAASEGCREISANALYLIHNSVCATEGNAAELIEKVDLLRQTDARIASVYAARSGRAAAEFEALMSKNNGSGRWLAPDQAVEMGLADAVIGAGAQGEHSVVRNIASGWERLMIRLGLIERTGQGPITGPQLPAGRNVLHFEKEHEELVHRSTIAIEEAQNRAAATTTLTREDPSYGDVVRSANERAYAEDVKRLRGM